MKHSDSGKYAFHWKGLPETAQLTSIHPSPTWYWARSASRPQPIQGAHKNNSFAPAPGTGEDQASIHGNAHMTATTLEIDELWIQPTGAALGADVFGVDISRPLPKSVKEGIAQAWSDHLVLRFSGQRL